MKAQITVSELSNLLETGSVRVIDGSWALDGTDMHSLYLKGHIPTAQFFDLDAISDTQSPLPHMAPSPDIFAHAVGNMGISHTDHVVIYDRQGLFSAARVWWTFRLMGHLKVQILRGGLPAWEAAGLALETGQPETSPKVYTATPNDALSMDIKTLKDISQNGTQIILDARPAARFDGTAPEPRAGLRSGHMPNSLNLPFGQLIEDGQLKSAEDLKAIFQHLNISPESPVVTTCGSGVTAAIIALALYETGHKNVRLYDGSWAEWGQADMDTPVMSSAS
ncbi:MAG: 3-mercaptopyruvate sulfurtransferase [Asticcacaulis sp.]